MANAVKVSELPVAQFIAPDDTLIINKGDVTTSKITIERFTTTFIGQSLDFTGVVGFGGSTTFDAGSSPTFNDNAVFRQNVQIDGTLVLGDATLFLGGLSDVTLPGTITNGNVLTWDATGGTLGTGQWVSAAPTLGRDAAPTLAGPLDTNNFAITGPDGSDVEVAPVGTGKFVVKGETAAQIDASITLNCYTNGHGVTIKSPPHSSASVYTLILPDSMGTSGQVLSTDGTDSTSWISVATEAQGVKADSALQPTGSAVLAEHADNAAAKTAGLSNGAFYRTGDTVKQVHS